MFMEHHAKFHPKRSPVGRVSNEHASKAVPTRPTRPRKPDFSVPILLTCVQEAPRKVSSKTESVWSGFQNLVRTVAKSPSPRTGAVPTPETGFFGPDPPNMCSRSTTQSFVHNGVRLVGFQKIMIDGKTNVCSCHLAFCS